MELSTGTYTVRREADGALSIELAPADGQAETWKLSAGQLATVRRFLAFNRELGSLFRHLTGGRS